MIRKVLANTIIKGVEVAKELMANAQIILFDIDGTLYEATNGISEQIKYEAGVFIVEYKKYKKLSFLKGEARKQFKKKYHKEIDKAYQEYAKLYGDGSNKNLDGSRRGSQDVFEMMGIPKEKKRLFDPKVYGSGRCGWFLKAKSQII